MASHQPYFRREDLRPGKLKKNVTPLIVDISLGVLFFVVAKTAGLTNAAIVGAVAGVALLIAQRLFKNVNLLGGLALYGVALMGLSALFAWYFQDDAFIKHRTTAMGLVQAFLFAVDSMFGGRWLGARLAGYLPIMNISTWRLALSVSIMSLIGSSANYVLAVYAPTDVWLFYTTFGDVALYSLMMFGALRWSYRPALTSE